MVLLLIPHPVICFTGQHHHMLPKGAVLCIPSRCCSCYPWPGVQQQLAGTLPAGSTFCSSAAAGQHHRSRASASSVDAAAAAIMQVGLASVCLPVCLHVCCRFHSIQASTHASTTHTSHALQSY
jgi:hypothetical protein